MRIRKRDGVMAEVGDGYVLQDGEALVVEMRMMDSANRTLIHDGNGNVAGRRPGYLVSDDDVAHAVLATVHQMYRDDIEQRWRSDRWQSGPAQPAPPAPPRFGTGDAAVAAAHEQYRRDISERWRG